MKTSPMYMGDRCQQPTYPNQVNYQYPNLYQQDFDPGFIPYSTSGTYQQQQYMTQQQQQQPYLLQQQHFHSYPANPQPSYPTGNTGNYVMKRAGPVGTAGQATAAATFYARNQAKATAQLSAQLPRQVDRFGTNSSEEDGEKLQSNFRSIICRAPPPLPSGLISRLEGGEDAGGLGKVRVIVRVTRCADEDRSKFFNVDKKKRQVTLLDPTVGRGEILMEERKVGVAAPKMFAYDGIYSIDHSQEELSTACLPEMISAVLNGNDGCLFCFGHGNLGKSYTMVGEDTSSSAIGVIPTAIAWLYRAIKERKQKTSSRFSVRVSAVEISQEEQLKDLLARFASDSDQSPGVYLRQSVSQTVLQNLSEVRASSVDKAAYYLDAALSARSTDSQGRQAHFLYTIHVYQYSVNKTGKGGVAGGRSRLHLIDFGGCERSQGNGITLSGLGNVILGIFNGQKHLPCRNSKLTGVLKECLSSLTCHATMVAHVSPEPSHYSETLHTLQLASRIHRMRRKKLKTSSSSRGSTSSDENRRSGRLKGQSGSSDFTSTDPSSSEMSCNTVVYRGQSDGSGTDGECPPPPPGLMRLKSRNLSGSRILTNGAISPRLSASPQPPNHSLSPASSQYLLSNSPARLTPTMPSIRESPQNKMPLNGRVPGYRQPAEIWIDGQKTLQQQLPGPMPVSAEQQRPYGFMDEFKANMISHWVDNQREGGSHFLTQFKQADSDSGSDKHVAKVEVHVEETPDRKKSAPPPPPPRRSSSREKELNHGPQSQEHLPRVYCEGLGRVEPGLPGDTQLSPRGETEGSDSTEPLPEPNFEQLFPESLSGIYGVYHNLPQICTVSVSSIDLR